MSTELMYLIWVQEAAAFRRPGGDWTAAVEEAGRFSAQRSARILADLTDNGQRTYAVSDPLTGAEYRRAVAVRLLSPEAEARLLAAVRRSEAAVDDLEDQVREQQYLRRAADERAQRSLVEVVLGRELVDELAVQPPRLQTPEAWANADAVMAESAVVGGVRRELLQDGSMRVVGVRPGAPAVTFRPEPPAITTQGLPTSSVAPLLVGNAREAWDDDDEPALWLVLEQVYRQLTGEDDPGAAAPA